MSLSPIGSAVFELLSHKHTDIQTDRHHITLEYRLPSFYILICSKKLSSMNVLL